MRPSFLDFADFQRKSAFIAAKWRRIRRLCRREKMLAKQATYSREAWRIYTRFACTGRRPDAPCFILLFQKQVKCSRKGTVLFFSLLRKEPKVAEGLRPSRLPENGSKLYRIVFSCCFRLSSLSRYVVRPAFSDVLNRCERVIVVQTQDRYFPKLGCRTASSQGHVTFKKGSCSLSLLWCEFKTAVRCLVVLFVNDVE